VRVAHLEGLYTLACDGRLICGIARAGYIGLVAKGQLMRPTRHRHLFELELGEPHRLAAKRASRRRCGRGEDRGGRARESDGCREAGTDCERASSRSQRPNCPHGPAARHDAGTLAAPRPWRQW
jgi:hypothetical protein